MASSIKNNCFGLDISDGALRLVKLAKKGKKISIVAYSEIELPPAIINNGEIQNEDKFIDYLKQLLKSVKGRKFSEKDCVSVLPETKTFIQVITVPTAKDEEELKENIKQEIKNHIPLTYEEIYLDWQVLKRKNDITRLLIGAAPRDVVDSYTKVIEKAGLTPNVLEIEAAAIIRAAIDKKDEAAKLIIDFGANRTGLIVYDFSVPQFTVSLPISGNNLTATIAKTLQIDITKAEKAKIVCGLDPNKCEGAMLKILNATISSLAKQVQKTIFFYKNTNPGGHDIAEILLSGGGASFSGMDKILSEKLKLPVRIANPLINIAAEKKLIIPKEKILSYTTVIGLGLRQFEK